MPFFMTARKNMPRDGSRPAMVYGYGGFSISTTPTYTAATGFDLTGSQFSINSSLWNGTGAARSAAWQGQLVSGRYAQRHDSHGVIEAITYIHPPALETAPGFAVKGSLPHHNEIAVDEVSQSSSHKLYAGNVYRNQYATRYAAAVQHIRKAFVDNWTHP